MMTSTFVSGPTAHTWLSLQLNQLVRNDTLFYRASLTVTFSLSWQTFVLLQGTCWATAVFGLTSKQLMPPAFTGLTALHSQVCFCLRCYGVMTVGLHNWGATARDGDSDDARRRRLEVCPEGAVLTEWLAGSSDVEHWRKYLGSLTGRISER